jgi:hypothetical protein
MVKTKEPEQPAAEQPAAASDKSFERRKRQAEALRRNLLLRKAQARRRENYRHGDGAPAGEGC